jgi:hypothetical protein
MNEQANPDDLEWDIDNESEYKSPMGLVLMAVVALVGSIMCFSSIVLGTVVVSMCAIVCIVGSHMATRSGDLHRPVPAGESFSLDHFCDAWALWNFRFTVDEIRQIIDETGLPIVINTSERDTCPIEEALCITLARLAHPLPWGSLMSVFRRSEAYLSRIHTAMAELLDDQHGHLLDWDPDRHRGSRRMFLLYCFCETPFKVP